MVLLSGRTAVLNGPTEQQLFERSYARWRYSTVDFCWFVTFHSLGRFVSATSVELHVIAHGHVEVDD